MHHDVQILEQVFGQTCFCSSKTFAHFFLLRTFFSPKTFGKDPLDSDHEEEMHSASETESDGQSESEAEFQEEAETKIEVMDDTGFAPEAESLHQDINAIQQPVVQHSQATQQHKSQVTSFIS
jgi:hypothetical protein